MALTVGTQAPEFTLFSSEKQEVKLSQFAGKNVVLLFVPMAFTGVCTAEFCSIRDEIKDYEDLNAEVIGISVDTVWTLEKWKAEQNYNFTLLSDYNKDVIKAYDAVHHDFAFGMKDVSKRVVYIIDKNGVIQYSEETPTLGDMPNLAGVKAKLSELN